MECAQFRRGQVAARRGAEPPMPGIVYIKFVYGDLGLSSETLADPTADDPSHAIVKVVCFRNDGADALHAVDKKIHRACVNKCKGAVDLWFERGDGWRGGDMLSGRCVASVAA